MKQYSLLEMEIISLGEEDVVRTSDSFDGGEASDVDVSWRPGW